MHDDWNWIRVNNKLLTVNDCLVLLGRCDRKKAWENG